MIYLDYSATTPVNEEVLNSFNKVCLDYIGNPNSLHKLGVDAKRLMDKAGVKCEVVSGQVRGSSEYHAWNIVALGTPEKYFHVDVTWDSDCYKVLYKYFCVTDAHMREKRIWDEHMGITCTCTDDILNRARAYVNSNKEKLLMRGINKEVIDFNGRN